MNLELKGGPRDGQAVEIDDGMVCQVVNFGLYFPHDERTIEPVAVYRWLFGEFDHLDFAGYHFMKLKRKRGGKA